MSPGCYTRWSGCRADRAPCRTRVDGDLPPSDRRAPPPCGRRRRHRHRRRQDVGRRPSSDRSPRGGPAASPPASRRSPSNRTTTPALVDAAVLGAASGESAEEVCPPHRWYDVAMAPPMAAEALGRPPFTIRDLMAELRWPAERPWTWVWSRRRAGCARRWPPTVTVSRCARRLTPMSWCWWPTPGWGRSTRCGSPSMPWALWPARWSSCSTASMPPWACTRATASGCRCVTH